MPSFQPISNNFTIFDIFTIDYDDSDSVIQPSYYSSTTLGGSSSSVKLAAPSVNVEIQTNLKTSFLPLPSQYVSLGPSAPVFAYMDTKFFYLFIDYGNSIIAYLDLFNYYFVKNMYNL